MVNFLVGCTYIDVVLVCHGLDLCALTIHNLAGGYFVVEVDLWLFWELS